MSRPGSGTHRVTNTAAEPIAQSVVQFTPPTCRAILSWTSMASAMALITLTAPAAAQDTSAFPNKTMTLIVNGGPGSLPDIFARPLAEKLHAALGQTVVVDNRPGAGGMVAMQALKSSDGSGHTLAIVTNAHAVWNPYVFPQLTYDPVKDLKPVSPIAVLPMALVTNAKVEADSPKAFFELAQAQPGVLNYASSGNGSPPHILFEILRTQAKADIVHVPFKTGPDALTSTIAGDTQVYFAGTTLVEPMVKDGRLKLLAVSPHVDTDTFKAAPTLEQAGYPGFENAVWLGVVAPAATPDAVVARINDAIGKALQDEAFEKTMRAQGSIPLHESATDFGQRIAAERNSWGPLLEQLGIRPN